MHSLKAHTLSDSVYELLRKEILNLSLKPGEKLSEIQTAARLEVSRGPVRKAFAKLEKEQLVEIEPNIGTIVAPVSIKRALDFMEIRILLEPYCAEISAKNIDDKDLKLIKDAINELDAENLTEGKRDSLLAVDALIHKIIWKGCGNQEIKRILESYSVDLPRIRKASTFFVDGATPSTKEIKEIAKPLFERSPKNAKKVMYKHLMKTKKVLMELYKNSNGRIRFE
jgi:DNA-binding GntR family transcriptional regulator